MGEGGGPAHFEGFGLVNGDVSCVVHCGCVRWGSKVGFEGGVWREENGLGTEVEELHRGRELDMHATVSTVCKGGELTG